MTIKSFSSLTAGIISVLEDTKGVSEYLCFVTDGEDLKYGIVATEIGSAIKQIPKLRADDRWVDEAAYLNTITLLRRCESILVVAGFSFLKREVDSLVAELERERETMPVLPRNQFQDSERRD